MTKSLDANGKIYMAANAILQPSKFSVSSMAILQQTSRSLRWTFDKILHGSNDTSRHLELIKSIYNTLKVDNQIRDGSRPYPQEDCKNDGMLIDVRYALRFQMLMCVHLQGGRDLSFSYPGSKSGKGALTNVSFSIKAGQLVVIVGPNGSGKSTIVKILNRLYDPTSGEVLLDGQPMKSYRISDLRQATADLTQDHTLYPLSIRENIGLGHPPCVSDMELIIQSAKLGGAYDFISKFEQGFDTTLHPIRTARMGHLRATSHPLKEMSDKLEKHLEVSGRPVLLHFIS
jgi:ABC-type multidrug transport system fused ATPase/permease subunit